MVILYRGILIKSIVTSTDGSQGSSSAVVSIVDSSYGLSTVNNVHQGEL